MVERSVALATPQPVITTDKQALLTTMLSDGKTIDTSMRAYTPSDMMMNDGRLKGYNHFMESQMKESCEETLYSATKYF